MITETNAVREKGLDPEQIIILSRSTGIKLACKTLNLLSSKDAMRNFDAFNTLEQALISLDLTTHQPEIIEFCSRIEKPKAVGQRAFLTR